MSMQRNQELLRLAIMKLSEMHNDEILTLCAQYVAEIPGDDNCRNIMCTRIGGRCVGWHCSVCGEPCSSQGHSGCND